MKRRKILSRSEKAIIEQLLKQGRPREAVDHGISISEWISNNAKISEGRVAAYLANLSRTKNGVLIIETTFESREHMSEAKHLRELLRIYNWNGTTKSYIARVRSKKEFLERLAAAKQWTVHISAHGKYVGRNKTILSTGIWSETSSEEFRTLWINKKHRLPKLMVMSACEAGHQDMANALSDAGFKHFIAPLHETEWHDAAVFNTLFYYYYSASGLSARQAFQATKKKAPNLTGVWSYFENGRKKNSMNS